MRVLTTVFSILCAIGCLSGDIDVPESCANKSVTILGAGIIANAVPVQTTVEQQFQVDVSGQFSKLSKIGTARITPTQFILRPDVDSGSDLSFVKHMTLDSVTQDGTRTRIVDLVVIDGTSAISAPIDGTISEQLATGPLTLVLGITGNLPTGPTTTIAVVCASATMTR